MIVALVQQPPVFLNTPGSVALAQAIIVEAARNDARLVVFPETWLPGYPVWLDHAPGSALWAHPPARALFDHYYRHSPEVGGSELVALAEAAASARVDVVMGLSERNGRTLYNATAIFGADGSFGIRRKLMPTFSEKLVWGLGDGSGLTAWDRPYGRVGSLICWEHWMPLARAAMQAHREAIHIAQWPALGELHQLASRTYAVEGQCAVIASGCVVTDDDVLDGFDSTGGSALARELLAPLAGLGAMKNGGSAVIAPDASYILEPALGVRETLYVSLDLDTLASLKMEIDTGGHYSRPDIFDLRVDRTARQGVSFESD